MLCYCNNPSNWGNSTFLWLWTTSVRFVFIWCWVICRFVFIWSWYRAQLVDIHMQTSCGRAAATICPRPSPPSLGAEVPRAAEPNAPADCNAAVGSHGQYVSTSTFPRSLLQLTDVLTPRWVKRPGDVDFESGVLVTCDVDYLCANISLLRPLCSRFRPDVCDRETDRRQSDRRQTASSLNPPRGWGIIIVWISN